MRLIFLLQSFQKARPLFADVEDRVTTLVHNLLVSPEDFSKHIDRSTASFAAIALFGQRAKTIPHKRRKKSKANIHTTKSKTSNTVC